MREIRERLRVLAVTPMPPWPFSHLLRKCPALHVPLRECLTNQLAVTFQKQQLHYLGRQHPLQLYFRKPLPYSLYTSRAAPSKEPQPDMKGEYFALCFLLLLSLGPAVSAEPACPQLRCAPPSTNVACFIGVRRCQCRCVADRDPCASLLHRSCPRGQSLSCNRNGYECRCRCVRK
ncbi:hypothetical protein V5799_010787 [Amblyomma americanum]|uniref:Uncharacterized protein n=1 Tax=Amblyomma americanum TaxID=6943 RepID=A0AAQ4EIP9_AMBAM